jgi:hypothetical protein
LVLSTLEAAAAVVILVPVHLQVLVVMEVVVMEKMALELVALQIVEVVVEVLVFLNHQELLVVLV